jgi:hypothetical protein
MSFETIFVQAGGTLYEGWTSARVMASAVGLARSFDLEVVEMRMSRISPFEQWPLLPGTPVEVYAFGSRSRVPSCRRPSGDGIRQRIQARGQRREPQHHDHRRGQGGRAGARCDRARDASHGEPNLRPRPDRTLRAIGREDPCGGRRLAANPDHPTAPWRHRFGAR